MERLSAALRSGLRAPRLWVLLLPLLVAAAWRIWLWPRYYGWEESDYGNLAMVRGVLDGGFRHYDMNHMPGYYGLGALALAVVGETELAARGVSLVGGLVAFLLSVRLADRLLGRRVAWLAALLLIFQPEFALYASTSLREPVYAAFLLGCLSAVEAERALLAGALAAGAFLVRMEGVLVLAPILAIGLRRPRRVALAWLPLLGAVFAWSLYCHFEHGTFLFWTHSVEVNVETGLGAEAGDRFEWWRNGGGVVLALLGEVLPARIGWGPALGLLLFGLGASWTRRGPIRTWAALAVGLLSIWLGIGLVAQHAPEHNLYWKWLCPIIPLIIPLSVAGLLGGISWLEGRVGVAAGRLLLFLVLAQAMAAMAVETSRQLALSASLYQPQRALGEMFEREVDPSVPLLIDNIPACWLNRLPNERPVTSWFDVPVPPGDPAAFGEWVSRTHIGWVLWFREDWTQAPVIAPFLAAGGTWEGGGVRLTERDREDGYGWILYEAGPLDPLDLP